MAKGKGRKKGPQFVSFIGTFKYPHLSEPSYGTDEYPKPDGEYDVRLIGKPEDPAVKAMIAKLKPLHEEAVERGKKAFKELDVATRKKLEKKNGKSGIEVKDLYSEVYDKETEEPTGEIEFRFGMKASGVRKKGPKAGKPWKRKPAIFDWTGTKPMQNVPDIWGGTTGRVSFEVGTDADGNPGYFVKGTGLVGLKLGLNAVRIKELVTGGERDADAYGFGAEEDEGYVHNDAAVKPKDEEDKPSKSDDDDAEAPSGDEDETADF